MPRILVKGVEGEVNSVDRTADWDENTNIKDYDIVFLDLRELEVRASEFAYPNSDASKSIHFPNPKDVYKLIKSGGEIIARLPFDRFISGISDEGTLDCLGWLPVKLETTIESGESVKFDDVSDEWKWYFGSSGTQSWGMHFSYKIDEVSDIGEYGDLTRERINNEMEKLISLKPSKDVPSKGLMKSIALNGYDEIIALSVFFANVSIGNNISVYDGHLDMVPSKASQSGEEFVMNVLENNYPDLDIAFGTEEIPDWIDEYTLPKEKEIHEKIRELQNQLEGMQNYKGLLYEKGTSLEGLVIQAFRDIGFEVIGEEPHGKDGEIKLDGLDIVIETHGTEGGIPREKCRQLDEWVEEKIFEGAEREVTGLLVVNPYCNKKPESREVHAQNVEDYLSTRGYNLITTQNLYKAVRGVRYGDLEKEEVRKRLADTQTHIIFNDINLK